MFRTGVPHLGPGATIQTFNVVALPHPGDIGMVWIKANGDYWQIAQNVDAVGVAGTNDVGGGVAYWKNYAGYQCTPTIGNSSIDEVAGIYENVVDINSFCGLRQGGTRKVKASNAVVYARGTPVIADIASNQAVAESGSLSGALSAAADTAGAIFSLVNPFGEDVFVDELSITTTVKSTGACTFSGGVTAVSGTTLSGNLIDGLDIGTATVTAATNFTNPGTLGKARQLWPAGTWLTGSTKTGNVAGTVGTYLVKVSRPGVSSRRRIGIALGARDGDGNVSVRLKIIPA